MLLVKLQFGAGHLRFSVSHPRANIATSSISVREMQPHKLACARARARACVRASGEKGIGLALKCQQSIPARSRINRRPRPPERIYIFADRRIIYPGRDYFVAGARERRVRAKRKRTEGSMERVGRQVEGNLRKLFASDQARFSRRRLNRRYPGRTYRGKRRLKYTGKFCCVALRRLTSQAEYQKGIYGVK